MANNKNNKNKSMQNITTNPKNNVEFADELAKNTKKGAQDTPCSTK